MVHTSIVVALMISGKYLRVVDEISWTDAHVVRSLKIMGGFYIISKTLTERAALEFAATHGFQKICVVLLCSNNLTVTILLRVISSGSLAKIHIIVTHLLLVVVLIFVIVYVIQKVIAKILQMMTNIREYCEQLPSK